MHDTYARHPRIGIAIGLPDLAKIDHATLAKVATYALELNLGVQVLLHPGKDFILCSEDVGFFIADSLQAPWPSSSS